MATAAASTTIASSNKSDSSVLRPTRTGEAQHYVGFANFPNQVYRRAIKHGFDFNIMVVGQSGLGKSTFINTLFLAEINDPKAVKIAKAGSTPEIDQKQVKLVEMGTTLRLAIVDTPGFGDAVDNSKCWEPILKFIEDRYLDFFTEETKIERKKRMPDRCIHLCLYFIAPTGHGLKQLDIEFMKKLDGSVNIVPVISKSDCFTKEELAAFKAQVMKDIEKHQIKVYAFPEPEDEDEKKQLDPLRARVPFAVVGSNQLKEEGGKRVRVREYPWGVVEVDSLAHNDFIALRDMIIRTNLVDLVDVTRNVHYENFRVKQMHGRSGVGSGSVAAAFGAAASATNSDPFTAMEEERKRREKERAQKQKEMDALFEEKVREKSAKLEAREEALAKRERELRALVEQKRRELEAYETSSIASHPRAGVSRSNSTVGGSHPSLASNENGLRTSPAGEKTKKRGGLFSRN